MAQGYRYHRPTSHLEFYTLGERQSSGPPPGEQPPFLQEFLPVRQDEPLLFEPDQPDIRGYAVNSPTGSHLGTVDGYLVDMVHHVVPYAYVTLEDGRSVVVPTNQFFMYPDQRLVTIEGGFSALSCAPVATYDAPDAGHADYFWGEYRRRNPAA